MQFYFTIGRMPEVFSKNIVVNYHLKAGRGLITQVTYPALSQRELMFIGWT